MSFVLYQGIFDNLFGTLRDQRDKAKRITLRGNSWPGVYLASGLPPLPFPLIAYGEEGDVIRYVKREPRDSGESFERAQGQIFDEFIIGTLANAKRIISRAASAKTLDIERSLLKKSTALTDRRKRILSHFAITGQKRRRIMENSERVLRFENSLVCAQVGYWISKFPSISLESLSESALPVNLRHKLDAPGMGFMDKIEPDFVYPHFSAIGDLKSGDEKRSDRIAITGYALAYEKQHREPIDFGIILYLSVRDCKTPIFKVSSFVISDIDRRAFVDIRDSKARLAKREMKVRDNA